MGNSPVLGAIYNPATVNTRPQVRSGRRRIVIDASGRGLYIGRPEWRDPHCSLPRVVCVRRAAARPTAHRQVKTLHSQIEKFRAARDLMLPRLTSGEIPVKMGRLVDMDKSLDGVLS